MHDNHCDGRTPNARFWEKVDSMAAKAPLSKSANIPEVDVSTPIDQKLYQSQQNRLSGTVGAWFGQVFSVDYRLFALISEREKVEKGTRSDNVYKDPQENTCRMLTVWSHPESYILPRRTRWLYAPMMWGKDHWVGLVINLTCRQVKILDCNIPLNESDNEVNKHMAYLRTLPHVLAAF
ncbi:hypothetical protein Bca52824_045766 [Brassica carinata]|uniref:Ubiquitin-like protease family profile domain-containing protein n=1 Tax=Brassica carinata TaxID=52824 RepID=A0A8X7RDT3_BRACI|nr:hypothetical protein Bca52824_045766 [Brassica carinata]